jgi:two-component system cell cycle sensor histidine kinase/response regulator CckA
MGEDDVLTAKPETPRRHSRLNLSWRISLLIAVLLFVSAIASTTFAVNSVRVQLYAQSNEAVGNVHASVAALVQAEFDGIDSYREQTLERRKQTLRDVAAPLVVALDELRASEQAGELTKEQAQTRAKTLLKTVRFADNDYFFTYDLDLNAIAHPDERFQGSNLTDLRDPDGKYVLREARDLVLKQGSGYTYYRWERLNGAEPSSKVGYVFLYEPWEWMIGTGVYVDDIEADVDRRIEELGSSLANHFEEISFNGNGFVSIIDRSGDVIASGAPDLAYHAATPEGKRAFDAILSEAPAEPGIEVEQTISAPWANGSQKAWSVRVSTTGGDLDWVVVSAVPEANLEAPGRTLARNLTVLAIVVLTIGLALGVFVSRRITKPVDDITRAARDLAAGSFDPTSLEAASRRSDEVGDLARTFQTMGTEIIERERRLRDQVEKLSVQIDRAKVAAEVQEITESDYFQRLKSRSRELRDRDG